MKRRQMTRFTWALRNTLALAVALLLGCGDASESSVGADPVVENTKVVNEQPSATLPNGIQQHLKSKLGMNDDIIATLTHERMPEGFIWAVLDPRVNMCFVYVKQQGEWQNVFMGQEIPTGWRPTNTGTGFMGNEAELHSLTVWVNENCQPSL